MIWMNFLWMQYASYCCPILWSQQSDEPPAVSAFRIKVLGSDLTQASRTSHPSGVGEGASDENRTEIDLPVDQLPQFIEYIGKTGT